MSMLALSGWGQPHDALREIAPDATHLRYGDCRTLEEVFVRMAPHKNVETAIGWSLGGQLAVRAVAAGIIAPKQLVLIATPYQFLKNEQTPLGMSATIFAQYKQNYHRDPQRTLTKSYALIAYGDVREDTVEGYLEKARKRLDIEAWHHWLELLEQYSCDGLDLSGFPPTLLLHGSEDAVVWPDQSQAYRQRLPKGELVMLEGCGHAPHWHDIEAVKRHIARHRT